MKETARESGMGNKQVRLTANLICRGAELGSCGTILSESGVGIQGTWRSLKPKTWRWNPGNVEGVGSRLPLDVQSVVRRGQTGKCGK